MEKQTSEVKTFETLSAERLPHLSGVGGAANTLPVIVYLFTVCLLRKKKEKEKKKGGGAQQVYLCAAFQHKVNSKRPFFYSEATAPRRDAATRRKKNSCVC